MSQDVIAPSLGESVSEIIIGAWRKSVGDRVEIDEPLVELESEKATIDLAAPVAGVITSILKQQGDSAEVGETLAVIEESAAEPKAPTAAKQSKNLPADQPPATSSGRDDTGHAEEEKIRTPSPASSSPEGRPLPAAAVGASAERATAPVQPAVSAPALPPAPAPAPRATPSPAPAKQPAALQAAPNTINRAATPQRTVSDVNGLPFDDEEEGVERVPMSPVRRRIAGRMIQAQQQAALLTTFNEVDMSAAKELRAKHGEAFAKRHGVKLGFMSLFVKAAVGALKQFPTVNAWIENDEIVYHSYYNIGVAVSTLKGLVVPTVRNADAMSLAEVELALGDLAKRSREGGLRVEDLQDGTFTITNGGIFGSLLSTPLVNPPQSGVLGMHSIQERPVAVDGNVVIRPMMYVALTYDHRLVDGEQAVRFLKHIADDIADPTRLWLDL
jgi:2-oxoglutarate dehydrogenase E2 component (dihydrolipoamide succinyltransferase)